VATKPTRPTEATVKRLFGKSGNRCAFPRCTVEMVSGNSVLGEVCHISAARPEGPRYDTQQSPEERHAYENLILLCGTHHKVIDDDVDAYTVERLRQMKANHEQRSNTLAENESEHGARLLLNQLVVSLNQSGGITAHTVNQIFNVYPQGDTARSGSQPHAEAGEALNVHSMLVDNIVANSGPVSVLDNGALVMHVVPLSTIGPGAKAPSFSQISNHPEYFQPIGGRVRDSRIDFRGLLNGSNAEGLAEAQRAYVMVFRSGVLEAVVSSLALGHEGRYLELPKLEATIVEHSRAYAQSLQDSGVPAPFAVCVSLIDVEDRELLPAGMVRGAFPEDLPSARIDQDRLDFAPCILDSVPDSDQESATHLRPILDHLANAAGLPSSASFDAAGNYLQ
jgi:hypothetical protein